MVFEEFHDALGFGELAAGAIVGDDGEGHDHGA